MFAPATKTQARARIALVGAAGSGKTMSALRIARGLVGPTGRIALIDTERGSASKYAHVTPFDTARLEVFTPESYAKHIKGAEDGGYDAVVIDGISPEWEYCLDEVARIERNQKGGNKFTAWAHVTPRHDAFVAAIVGSTCHILATMRAKTEYVLEQNDRGKQVPRKVGLKPIQRDNIDYEFDIVLECNEISTHHFRVDKTRCEDLEGEGFTRPDEALGQRIAAWLSDGAPAAPAPATAPQQPTATTDTDPREALAAAVTVLQGAGDKRDADALKRAIWDEARAIGKARAERGVGPGRVIAEDITVAVEQLTAPESSEVAS